MVQMLMLKVAIVKVSMIMAAMTNTQDSSWGNYPRIASISTA